MAEPASVGRRPVIAIPARFSESASALRHGAIVVSHRLAQAVWDAGGDPVVLLPHAPDAVIDLDAARDRLRLADGVLLPGGGDVAARWANQQPHPSLYHVNEEQDAFDIAVARVAIEDRLPLLAICRGTQIVNVSRGGDLVQDMDDTVGNHWHRTHEVTVVEDSPLGDIVGRRAMISCYHHQCISRLGDGLREAAHSADGVIEAVTLDGHEGWLLGVQWHPEDDAASDPVQAEVFSQFVRASAHVGARR